MARDTIHSASKRSFEISAVQVDLGGLEHLWENIEISAVQVGPRRPRAFLGKHYNEKARVEAHRQLKLRWRDVGDFITQHYTTFPACPLAWFISPLIIEAKKFRVRTLPV